MTSLLVLLFWALLAVALPPSKDLISPSVEHDGISLAARQNLVCCTAPECCTSCTASYDYSAYWRAFDHFCYGARDGIEIWTDQTYYSFDAYCNDNWDPNVCIILQVSFTCGLDAMPANYGTPSAATMDYNGCMGYFQYAIENGACGGPPYPGARVMTPDRCWSFIAAGGRDSGIKLTNTIAAAKKRKCNEDLKQCTVPMKNGKVVPGYVRDFDFAAPKAL